MFHEFSSISGISGISGVCGGLISVMISLRRSFARAIFSVDSVSKRKVCSYCSKITFIERSDIVLLVIGLLRVDAKRGVRGLLCKRVPSRTILRSLPLPQNRMWIDHPCLVGIMPAPSCSKQDRLPVLPCHDEFRTVVSHVPHVFGGILRLRHECLRHEPDLIILTRVVTHVVACVRIAPRLIPLPDETAVVPGEYVLCLVGRRQKPDFNLSGLFGYPDKPLPHDFCYSHNLLLVKVKGG